MLKALLADLDGTLVQTAAANARAYTEALAADGVIVDEADLARRIDGRSWREFLPEVTKHAPELDLAAVARRKQTLYPKHLGLVQLNHAVADLIRAVRPSLKTGLVTTAASNSVSAIMAHLGLHDLFDVVVCGDDVSRRKPDPEAYHLAATRLGVAPAECLILEDSVTGMEAARTFGGGLLRWMDGIPFGPASAG